MTLNYDTPLSISALEPRFQTYVNVLRTGTLQHSLTFHFNVLRTGTLRHTVLNVKCCAPVHYAPGVVVEYNGRTNHHTVQWDNAPSNVEGLTEVNLLEAGGRS